MAKTSIIKETRDILWKAGKEAKDHWKEPPAAQVPVGDSGWYTSPNLQTGKAVDPLDCDHYPDSPYCGGNPWTKTPVGFDFDYGVDKCGVWVEATPIVLFTKLPPISVGYRQPGACREEPKPPPPPPIPDDDGRPVDPLDFPQTIDPNVLVFVVIVRSYRYDYSLILNQQREWIASKYIEIQSVADTFYPSVAYVEPYTPLATAFVPAIGGAKVLIQGVNAYGDGTNEPYQKEEIRYIASDQQRPQIPNNKRYIARELKGDYLITGLGGKTVVDNASCILYGTINEMKKDWQGIVFDSTYNLGGGIYHVKAEWKIAYISIPDSRNYPLPPDQKRKKDCCMQCCNGGNQAANKQNQDNAEILRLLRKIDKKMGDYPFKVVLFDADDNKVGAQSKTVSVASVAQGQKLIVEREEKNAKSIGIDHFPIYVPSSIVEDESNGILGDIGDLKNKIFKQKIESLAELQLWKTKNDYEIFGRWQEVIEVQDSDPTKKGNQPKRVILPNMAKSFKEIILLLTVLIRAQGFSLDSILKMYVDVAGIKTSTAATEAITRDIQDYLDYPTITKTLDVPIGIKVPTKETPAEDREDIEEFLKSSTVKVVFDDWTGEGSIHDMLIVLLDAAARQIQKPHT